MNIIGSINVIEWGFWLTVPAGFLGAVLNDYLDKYLPPALIEAVRYGRMNYAKIQTNFILNKFQVPKSWFFHFYIFGSLFHSVVFYTVLSAYWAQSEGNHVWLVQLLTLMTGNNRFQTVNSTTTILVTFLFLLHVYRRLYESYCVCVYSNTKFNVVMYLYAYFYYFSASLSLIAHSPIFCYDPREDSTMSWEHLTIYHLVGVAVVLYGFKQQYLAHLGFANLRKGKDKRDGSQKHYIPTGGLFDLISTPNYWAEIVIYIGFCIIFRFQNSTFNAVAAYVISSHIFIGRMNHRWYLETFPQYPKERKAIIPYIF